MNPVIPNSAPRTPLPMERAAASAVRLSVHHAIDRAYREIVQGRAREDLLRTLCHGLAEALAVPFFALVRQHEGGTLELEACSRESALWAELMRLPERWDGTIAGNGPASRALHAHQPVVLAVSDEGFMPWREAARRDGIREICAWPLDDSKPARVLLLACDATRDAASLSTELGVVATGCAHVLADFERNQHQALLAAALRHAGNAAFVADTDGQIVWCNAALSALTGYPVEDVIGRNPRFLSSGRHGIRHYRELWNTIRSGRIWRGETVDRDRNGAAFTALQTISPFGADGRVTHYLALYDDITRQKDEETRRALHAAHDPLTGLMHRAALEHAFSQRLAQHRVVRLARLAARNLAQLEALGAAALDTVLLELQARVRTVIGADRVAKLSAGEYLLELPEDEAQARQVTETLLAELREPYPLVGALPGVDLRVGAALSSRDGQDLDALLRAADRALGAEPLRAAHRQLAQLPD